MKLIKKIGFLTLVLLCRDLLAQEGDFRLGFQINPGLSWITTNAREITNTGANPTVGLGTQGEIGLSELLSITAGVGLTFNRGGTLRHETGGNFFPESRLSDDSYNTGQKPLPDGTRLKYHLHYVHIPISLKWYLGRSDLMQYYVDAPILTWGFTTQRRGDIKAGDIRAEKENIAQDVNPFNLTLGLGGGVEYSIGSKTALILGLSFHGGLPDLTSDKATIATPNPDDNPFDPNDDYIPHQEDAHAVLNAFVIHIGILF